MSDDELSDDTLVWVRTHRSGDVKRIHTDEDCDRVKTAKNPRQVEYGKLFDDMEMCKFCAGEDERGEVEQDRDYYLKAKKIGERTHPA